MGGEPLPPTTGLTAGACAQATATFPTDGPPSPPSADLSSFLPPSSRKPRQKTLAFFSQPEPRPRNRADAPGPADQAQAEPKREPNSDEDHHQATDEMAAETQPKKEAVEVDEESSEEEQVTCKMAINLNGRVMSGRLVGG